MPKFEEIDTFKVLDPTDGINAFPDAVNVYWTDGSLNASEQTGRREIALELGIETKDLVCFSQVNHTNEIVVVDSVDGLTVLDPIYEGAVEASRLIVEGGWSEPIRSDETSSGKGVERSTYDGIILVNSAGLEGKHLLVTGADCTPVAIRARLHSGEEVIAVAHGGRRGTMTGVIDNLVAGLQFLGINPATAEVFIGPSAQDIEVPLGLLAAESTLENPRPDNSWRAHSVSEEYVDADGRVKVEYQGQFDATRRMIEGLGIEPKQVRCIDADTVSDDRFHSFRRTKTDRRNCVVIGFKDRH